MILKTHLKERVRKENGHLYRQTHRLISNNLLSVNDFVIEREKNVDLDVHCSNTHPFMQKKNRAGSNHDLKSREINEGLSVENGA